MTGMEFEERVERRVGIPVTRRWDRMGLEIGESEVMELEMIMKVLEKSSCEG